MRMALISMNPETDKIEKGTGTGWFGWQVLYGYFFQAWVGRLRLHVFTKHDPGEALHDHTWPFSSLPFHAYVEEYLDGGDLKRQVIPAFRLNRKAATHTHRYLGKWTGVGTEHRDGLVVTICWRGKSCNQWRYWRMHKGQARSYEWQSYLRRIEAKPRMEANP